MPTAIGDIEEERHRHAYQIAADETCPNEKGQRVPSVKVSATKNSAKGGMPTRALTVANATESSTYGARILKSYGINDHFR